MAEAEEAYIPGELGFRNRIGRCFLASFVCLAVGGRGEEQSREGAL
jgi:hypothetical protein